MVENDGREVLVVAVTTPGGAGALRRLWAAVRLQSRRTVAAITGAVRASTRSLLAAVLALRALVGLLLVAYGAWLAWEPGGPIVLGLGLLVDRASEALPARAARSNQ
jgi:hypothetical protein